MESTVAPNSPVVPAPLSAVFLPRKEPVALLRSILPILEGAAPPSFYLARTNLRVYPRVFRSL